MALGICGQVTVMRNSTIQKVDMILLGVAFVGLFSIIAAVCLLSQNTVLSILIGCLSVVVLVCILAIRHSARKQFVAFSDNICQQLDQIIEYEADTIKWNGLEDETLPAKVGAKLLRITEVTKGAAEQSNQLKKNVQELVSDISHQLKTPLSNIKMAAETLADENTEREWRKFSLSGLKQQVDKLEFLIEAMTKISRLENGMIIPKPEPSPLSELLNASVLEVYPFAKEKEINIKCAETKQMLNFDMRWTTEAFFNILENAVKYTLDGGEITISVYPMPLYTRIDISDTGIGIKQENRNNVFKRFYRENRMRQTKGVGVGLYLSREIISKQGGYITVKSIENKGTTISVYLVNSNLANEKS